MRIPLAALAAVTAVLMSGCSLFSAGPPQDDSSWTPVDDMHAVVLASTPLTEVDADPEVAWSGRLIERDGCFAVEVDGRLQVAAFFADAVVVRDASGALGVRTAPSTVLVAGRTYAGGQMPLTGRDQLAQLTDGLECADALGVDEAVLIHSAEPTDE